MIKSLDTHAIFAELNSIIEKANKFLFLVSPFIKMDGEQLASLKAAVDKGFPVTIIYRLNDSKTLNELKKVSSFPNIKIIGCPDLHAKIYANEKKAILSSRNLTTRQEGCSIEVGVVFTKSEITYRNLIETVKKLMNVPNTETLVDNQYRGELGYCIKCGKRVKIDINTPFCESCLIQAKTEYKNTPQRYCHFCGKKAEVCWYLPMEHDCYFEYMKTNKIFEKKVKAAF